MGLLDPFDGARLYRMRSRTNGNPRQPARPGPFAAAVFTLAFSRARPRPGLISPVGWPPLRDVTRLAHAAPLALGPG
eukprot:330548-Pyramimonas_sp.AAC.1